MQNKQSVISGQWSVVVRPWPLVLICLLSTLALTGCNSHSEEVQFHRFEQLLFDTPADKLQSELQAHHNEYNTDLIVIAPENAEYIQMVQEFTTDPIMRDIYHITDSIYHDFHNIERQLGKALGQAYRLCPEMPHLERFYTMVGGDYNNFYSVYTNGKDLCIMLDDYAIPAMERYQYFGMPNYIIRQSTGEQIVPDCMRRLAENNIHWPDYGQTLLDYAIAEGKVLYFVEKTMPGITDTILLRYTKDQLDWMHDNLSNVWGWMIQNKMLYSTDIKSTQNLINDAPHTNAFGAGSAPRTANYIGYQIVRAYMKRSGATMQQLFDETDSQLILTTSNWRP